MLDITKLIDLLPDDVKKDIIDFTDVKLKDGRIATRVVLDRLLTEDEKKYLSSGRCKKRILGVDCVAQYRYAPEIKKSYFYVL